MRKNLIFLLGLVAMLGVSWAGIIMASYAQLGSLVPFYDDSLGTSFPLEMPGVAAQGQLVYRDLGCTACHTQQVRRPSFGSDKERGWGERQSVARDYIFQPFPQLGLSRIGPDLTNFADRKPTAPDASELLRMLYAGSSGMPSYRFLFRSRRVGMDAQPSEKALKLDGALEPRAGWEIVPTPRADSLVAYLLSLRNTYMYPEAVPATPGAVAPGAAPTSAPSPTATSTAGGAGGKK